jgi:hypothetical protein
VVDVHRRLGEHSSDGPDVNHHEKGPRMSMDEIQSENEPTGPHPTATDRAVAAVERMMDASSRVSNAYADAYQEAVISMADRRGKLGDPGRDGLRVVPRPAGADPLRKPLRDATKTVTRVNQHLLAASRQLSLAYMDAYEQAVLCRVDMRDEAPTTRNGDSARPVDSPRHGIGCEVTRAYVDVARRMLS